MLGGSIDALIIQNLGLSSRPEIATSEGVGDDMKGDDLGKSDFRVIKECTMCIYVCIKSGSTACGFMIF